MSEFIISCCLLMSIQLAQFQARIFVFSFKNAFTPERGELDQFYPFNSIAKNAVFQTKQKRK